MAAQLLIIYVLSILAILGFKRIAPALGYVDRPGGRKSHREPVPQIGGVAMFTVWTIACFTCLPSDAEYFWLWLAMAMVVGVGILDDLFDARPRLRLGVQLLAVALMSVIAGHAIHLLFSFLWPFPIGTGLMAIPLTIFAIVTLINAVNMLDGLDGLAGGIVFGQLLLLSITAQKGALIVDTQALCLFACILFGFLSFNFPIREDRQASVFMGDAGSMMLAVLVGWYVVKFTQEPTTLLKPVTILWILALPLFDIICVIVRRIRKGQPLFKADHSHFHHIFLQAGYTKRETVYIIVGASFIVGCIGWLLDSAHVADEWMLAGIFALFAGYYWINLHAWKMMKLIRLRHKRRRLHARLQAGESA